MLVAIPAGLYIAGTNYFSTRHIYEGNWNITIPYTFKEKYNKASPTGFHGDGERYTIFVSNNSKGFTDRNKFTEKPNAEIKPYIYRVMDELNIPKDKRVPTGKKYKWFKKEHRWPVTGKFQLGDNGDVLVILWFEDTHSYYFVESTM